MKDGIGKIVCIALGVAVRAGERLREAPGELERRGREKAEDLRVVLDDLREAFPCPGAAGSGKAESERGLADYLLRPEARGLAGDVFEELGLARRVDVEDMSLRLDKMAREVKNLKKKNRGVAQPG
ncbi:MAG: hypothetical protein AB1742_03540 [bacterium]